MRLEILCPTFVLVGLIFVVWLTVFAQRVNFGRRVTPQPGDLATKEATTKFFQPVEMSANNLGNLFEMPVLYFALVPLLILTAQITHVQVVLAWIFVILRVLHSLVHIVLKNPTARGLVWLLSSVILLVMWIGFAIDLYCATPPMDVLPA